MQIKNFFRLLAITLLLTGSTLTRLSAQNYLPYNYWTFDGANPLQDSMNNYNLDPAFFNSPYTIAADGIGKSFRIDDGAKKIRASNPLPLDSGFTMEFLFKPDANINHTVVFGYRGDGAINIRFNYAFFRFSTKITPTGSSTGISHLWDKQLDGIGRGSYGYYMDGNWHHLVFKYNARTGIKEIWVDGQLPEGFSDTVPETGAFAANAGSTTLNTFYLNETASYYKYEGAYDEMAIYPYALPGNMIYKHYTEFMQNKHYSFSNSNIAPPAPDPVIGDLDPFDYAPGNPTPTVDALDQLKGFPVPRFKPGNTLQQNLQGFNPSYLAGRGFLSDAVAVPRSKEFQREMVTNYNYMFLATANTTNSYMFGDTNKYDGAWVKMAKDNPTWKVSANSYWPQISPRSIGKVSNDPYAQCQTLPNSSYLRNAAGQYLDQGGNVTTAAKYLSPEAPLDSIYFDGLTQKFHITTLVSKMGRNLNLLFENGEIIRHYNSIGIHNDPVVDAAMIASGLSNVEYVGNRMRRFVDAYTAGFENIPQMAGTRFMHYQIDGLVTNWHYGQTRTINSALNGKRLSSGDIYVGNPKNWRYGGGDWNGWQDVIESRYNELAYGDSLWNPVVSPGWTFDESRITRPGTYLGFLKAVALTGVESFMTGYFVTAQPYQLPENYVWQMVYPPYVHAVISRYEDLLRNGHLMDGDVSVTPANTTQPGYSFEAGDERKLVVARKHNTLNKYVITGSIQPNSNQQGNAAIADDASIKLDGQTLKFNVRRQGSTYIYDNTNTAAPIFYQIDGWHEYKHPYYWSKSFDLEAELYDNTAPVSIKTKTPTGSATGDFTNYTSYLSFLTAGTVEYNFQPRGAAPANHYLWILARSKDGSAQSLNITLDGTINKAIGCIQDTNWTWYRYDATLGIPMVFNNLSLQNHKLSITSNTTKVEIDKITISPSSANIYTGNVAPVCNQGVAGLAIISPTGNTTFCQGDSVTLIANTGTSYLWSTGAISKSIVVKTAGSYIVTVTNGTSAISLPQVVVVNPIPVSTVSASGPTTFCAGGSVVLTATLATGSYLWTPGGATTRAINVTNAGNYSVVVTNTGGCSATSAITTVAIGGSGTPASITPSGATTFCQGSSVNLMANAGNSYLWSNGATTNSISANSTGNYAVTVTYASGCSSTAPVASVTVNPTPSNGVTASGSTTFCSGGSVTLTANSATGTYLWTPGGATTRAITVTNAGNYSVVVTGTGGCSATSAVTAVAINGSGTPATITPSGVTTFCQGGSVNLSANAGNSYLWSNGATTNSIAANSTGNYAVTVTYASGCSSTAPVASVTVNPIPSNGVTASGPTTFCGGGSVTLTANSATGTYLWTPGGATTRAITVTNAGNYSVVVTGAGGCSTTSAVTAVTISGSGTPATITPSGATTFCQGGNVNLSANSGNSYLWSNGATTNSINANSTGNYAVTVTYASGCSSTAPVASVTVNPIPSNGVTASGATTFCSGGSVTLTANNATGTYLWTPGGATTRAITVTNAGNYSVVVTGAGGCSATSAVTAVTINNTGTPATITPSGATSFCQGGNVTLTANSGNSYLWSNGATTNSISANSTGNYGVTVTYALGCSSTAPLASVTVNPIPSNGVTASGPTTFCSGGSVTLTANSATGTYLWTPGGATTRAITVSNAGNYSVVVTGAGGCSSTSAATSVTISGSGTPATITSAGATTFCQGGSVNLTANSGTSYLWSNGATTRTISANTTGNYLVTVTYTGGCTSTSQVTSVTSNPIPSNGVTASGPTAFCNGGSVTLTATNATGTYLWTPGGATTRSITVSNTGNYAVTVTSANCTATSNPISVTQNTGTIATPTLTNSAGTNYICSGGNIVVRSSLANSYLWSTGATTRNITISTGGSYAVTVSNGSGCTATSAPMTFALVPQPTFTFTATGPLTFCAGGSVTFNVSQAAGQSYIWYKDNVQIPGANLPNYTVNNAGYYRVRVQKNGCPKISGTAHVTVPCRDGESILDANNDLQVNAYPNPFSNQTTISFILPEDNQVTVKIFDMEGRLVDVLADKAQYIGGAVEISYDARNLGKGLYFATVTTGSYGTKTIKISSL